MFGILNSVGLVLWFTKWDWLIGKRFGYPLTFCYLIIVVVTVVISVVIKRSDFHLGKNMPHLFVPGAVLG